MRVLLVSHLYPPRHSGGTELYTAELARRLQLAGHEVRVFTTDKDISREDLTLAEREHEGIHVHELTSNLYYAAFEETWGRPEVDALFGAFLERWRPDLLNVQHLMYLSAGCLREAARRGIPIVYTLHDFWLECPRFGQLVHADGSLCARVDFARCGTCLSRFKWRQSDLERRAGRHVAAMRRWSGLDFTKTARRLALLARARTSQTTSAQEVDASTALAYEHAALTRTSALRELVRATVDRFVAPSHFLAQRMLAFGLERERLRVIPTGIDRARFAPRPRVRGAQLAVRFFGTLVPLKGAHVLLEAWRMLLPAERAGAELVIYGSRGHAPDYQRRLDELARESGARLGGMLGRAEVARELAACDLCVVPSLWFENRPLIVLEALATRTPLLVTDAGGLSELVVEGVAGWRFPMGDAPALAQRLRAIVAQRNLLDGLYSSALDLPSWEDTTQALLALYAEILAEQGA